VKTLVSPPDAYQFSEAAQMEFKTDNLPSYPIA